MRLGRLHIGDQFESRDSMRGEGGGYTHPGPFPFRLRANARENGGLARHSSPFLKQLRLMNKY